MSFLSSTLHVTTSRDDLASTYDDYAMPSTAASCELWSNGSSCFPFVGVVESVCVSVLGSYVVCALIVLLCASPKQQKSSCAVVDANNATAAQLLVRSEEKQPSSNNSAMPSDVRSRFHKPGCQDDSSIVWRQSRAAAKVSAYEMSEDFRQKQVEALERKYGGHLRARRAAIVIQRGYRSYRLAKQFEQVRSARMLRYQSVVGETGEMALSAVAGPPEASHRHTTQGERWRPLKTVYQISDADIVYSNQIAVPAPDKRADHAKSSVVSEKQRSKSTERYGRSQALCIAAPTAATSSGSPRHMVNAGAVAAAVKPFKILSDREDILRQAQLSPTASQASENGSVASSGPDSLVSPASADFVIFPTDSYTSCRDQSSLLVTQRVAASSRTTRIVVKPDVQSVNFVQYGQPVVVAPSVRRPMQSSLEGVHERKHHKSEARLAIPHDLDSGFRKACSESPVWVRKTLSNGVPTSAHPVPHGCERREVRFEQQQVCAVVSSPPLMTPESPAASETSSGASSAASSGSGTTQSVPLPQPSDLLSRSLPESSFLTRCGVAPKSQPPPAIAYAIPSCCFSAASTSTANNGSITGFGRDGEVDRKRKFRVALNFFNKKPERGIELMIHFGFVDPTPAAVARFLTTRRGLSKQKIGEYLGNLQLPFNMAVLDCFVRDVNFQAKEIDVALREFLKLFRLPGEAQKIERIMEVFARRYCECNPGPAQKFKSCDSVFVLAFAIIMLNTDLHSPNVKAERKMKLEDFKKNLKGVDDFDGQLLAGIYARVKEKEFKPGSDHVTQVMAVDRNVVGKKPMLVVPHRRLVCYCRLYEVADAQKKQSAGAHQREIFLFNDLILVTKVLNKKKQVVTYSYRQSHSLVGMQVQAFRNQHYKFGIRVTQTLENKVLMFNARSDEDKLRFLEDLQESVLESDQMEALRIEQQLEKQKMSYLLNPATRTHSLGRGENRDSGLADMDPTSTHSQPNAPLKRTKHALSNSVLNLSHAEERKDSIDQSNQADNRARRSSVNSLDSGMSSTASTASRESSPKTSQENVKENGAAKTVDLDKPVAAPLFGGLFAKRTKSKQSADALWSPASTPTIAEVPSSCVPAGTSEV